MLFFIFRRIKIGLRKFVPDFLPGGKTFHLTHLSWKSSNGGFFIFGISAITHERLDRVKKLFHSCNQGGKTFHLTPLFNFAKNRRNAIPLVLLVLLTLLPLLSPLFNHNVQLIYGITNVYGFAYYLIHWIIELPHLVNFNSQENNAK